MASYLAVHLLAALLTSASAVAVLTVSASSDIVSAAQEMQQARYFTFVMLIRMVQEKISRNTTFLMPNDRLLSTASIPENQVLEFLARHSIPAPLLFDDLLQLPNGTILPTHQPSYMVTVTNRDQKLYFNNVELINPDILAMPLHLLRHQSQPQLPTDRWSHPLYHLRTQVLPQAQKGNLQQKALKAQPPLACNLEGLTLTPL